MSSLDDTAQCSRGASLDAEPARFQRKSGWLVTRDSCPITPKTRLDRKGINQHSIPQLRRRTVLVNSTRLLATDRLAPAARFGIIGHRTIHPEQGLTPEFEVHF